MTSGGWVVNTTPTVNVCLHSSSLLAWNSCTALAHQTSFHSDKGGWVVNTTPTVNMCLYSSSLLAWNSCTALVHQTSFRPFTQVGQFSSIPRTLYIPHGAHYITVRQVKKIKEEWTLSQDKAMNTQYFFFSNHPYGYTIYNKTLLPDTNINTI